MKSAHGGTTALPSVRTECLRVRGFTVLAKRERESAKP
jgi:hypothetical protein